MNLLHCNPDGSPSWQVNLQVNFDLLLDRFDTSSSPFLLVLKLESVAMLVVLDGHISSLVSRDLVSCANVCFVSNSCFVQ